MMINTIIEQNRGLRKSLKGELLLGWSGKPSHRRWQINQDLDKQLLRFREISGVGNVLPQRATKGSREFCMHPSGWSTVSKEKVIQERLERELGPGTSASMAVYIRIEWQMLEKQWFKQNRSLFLSWVWINSPGPEWQIQRTHGTKIPSDFILYHLSVWFSHLKSKTAVGTLTITSIIQVTE